ncbi:hypothetical protein DFH06DRAFT_453525 [Mycena polygramma]|nr:hypothetical protein DFH06DRAFT_453525 [Mycena polygramma]
MFEKVQNRTWSLVLVFLFLSLSLLCSLGISSNWMAPLKSCIWTKLQRDLLFASRLGRGESSSLGRGQGVKLSLTVGERAWESQ